MLSKLARIVFRALDIEIKLNFRETKLLSIGIWPFAYTYSFSRPEK